MINGENDDNRVSLVIYKPPCEIIKTIENNKTIFLTISIVTIECCLFKDYSVSEFSIHTNSIEYFFDFLK